MIMDNEDKMLEFFQENLERDGYAVITVKDGHIIGLKKSVLEQLLKKNPDSEKLLIFVQKREFKN